MRISPENVEVETMKKLVDIRDKKILEIGSGSGRVSKFIILETANFTGIDLDERKILKAKEQFPDIDFRIGSGMCLEFSDATFDIVIFTLSLHHIDDPEKALMEASRVLKYGGDLIIIEPFNEGELCEFMSSICDESEELNNVFNILEDYRQNDVFLNCSDFFSSDWIYEDVQDFKEYFLGRYGEIELEKIEEMAKNNNFPLILKDDLYINHFKKKKDEI